MKRRKKSNRLLALITRLLFLIILMGFCTMGLTYMAVQNNRQNNLKETRQADTDDNRNDFPLNDLKDTFAVTGADLASRNAILISLDDQEILLDKDSNSFIYPASLTKIMTCILAIENLSDLNRSVTLSSHMFNGLYKDNASLAGFLPGETVAALDLLYGILLPSGAECSIGLAEHISGSEEEFVKLMNEKAAELHMDNTHFVNTTGLHDPDHYSTVSDIAELLKYSLENETFRMIFTAKRHSAKPTDLHPDGITFYSTMFRNMESAELKDGMILGGKTGYTSKAGLCLASLAEINQKEYIMVTANAVGDHSTAQYNIEDAFYTYGKIR